MQNNQMNNPTQGNVNQNMGVQAQTGMTQNVSFADKEIADDVLHSEKQMITAYGTYLAEATCQNLRNELTKILNDKQQIQYQLYDYMKQKGWYPAKNAPLTEVDSAVQKFGSMKQQMSQ